MSRAIILIRSMAFLAFFLLLLVIAKDYTGGRSQKLLHRKLRLRGLTSVASFRFIQLDFTNREEPIGLRGRLMNSTHGNSAQIRLHLSGIYGRKLAPLHLDSGSLRARVDAHVQLSGALYRGIVSPHAESDELYVQLRGARSLRSVHNHQVSDRNEVQEMKKGVWEADSKFNSISDSHISPNVGIYSDYTAVDTHPPQSNR